MDEEDPDETALDYHKKDYLADADRDDNEAADEEAGTDTPAGEEACVYPWKDHRTDIHPDSTPAADTPRTRGHDAATLDERAWEELGGILPPLAGSGLHSSTDLRSRVAEEVRWDTELHLREGEAGRHEVCTDCTGHILDRSNIPRMDAPRHEDGGAPDAEGGRPDFRARNNNASRSRSSPALPPVHRGDIRDRTHRGRGAFLREGWEGLPQPQELRRWLLLRGLRRRLRVRSLAELT